MAEVVKKPLKITETVLRDAHQSLIATRMTTEQMLPIVDKMDKVAINSAAYDNLSLITEGAKLFGSQCIVASIDCRKIDGEYHCFSHNGAVDTGWLLQDWIVKVVEAGAGEILLTSVELDGTMEGYDVEMIKIATSLVNVPVIASGGAGNYEHMRKAVQEGGASAVAAASIYHFTEQTPKEAKEYLGEHGVAVRMI